MSYLYALRFVHSPSKQPVEWWPFDRMTRFFDDDQLNELANQAFTYLNDGTFVQLLTIEADA